MKKRSVIKNFMITMTVLGFILALLWVGFFMLTKSAVDHDTVVHAETISDSIISNVENELLLLEDTAINLSEYDRIIDMVNTRTIIDFYDKGQVVEERAQSIIGKYCPADSVVIYRADGNYYRIRGEISNTALNRAYNIISSDDVRILTVTANSATYVGCARRISGADNVEGYVVLLMNQSKLEKMLSEYNDYDYLGIALMSEGNIMCSNKALTNEGINQARRDSVFIKEKEVGLTGFNLLVYCDSTVTREMGGYFAIAMPITIIILLATLTIFNAYWKKHMLEPINIIINNTNEALREPIPHTGEPTFDNLVDHVNETLLRVEDRDRTLLSLLKKQISAHFTVNTLNAVRALINRGDKENAAHMCDELSYLLRYANAGDEYISLMEESFVLKQYVSIMQIRYPNRFEFEIENEEQLDEEVYIPRMLLQPIIENAILHGFVNAPGKIIFKAEMNDMLTISIEDNGCGMEKEKLEQVREKIKHNEILTEIGLEHVALININKRIAMVCGDNYGLTIDSEKGKGVSVKVTLPIIKNRNI